VAVISDQDPVRRIGALDPVGVSAEASPFAKASVGTRRTIAANTTTQTATDTQTQTRAKSLIPGVARP
jgi:hypothetical protein